MRWGPASFALVLTSMASLVGWCGYYYQGTITTKELVPVVIAAALWGRSWHRIRICFHVDNMEVVVILRRYSAGSEVTHHLLRCLYFYSALFQFEFSAEHIPGVQNVAADALSRDNLVLFSSLLPQATQVQIPASRLGISELDQCVQGFFANGLAPATWTAYHSFANRYLGFCAEFRLIPLPLSQDTITRFVAYLARSGLTNQSIRSYLAGVRFLQIACGLPDPDLAATPVLNYVMCGVR